MLTPGAMPPLGRMMVFIDGENLVCRYQDMKGRAAASFDDIQWKQNVFVWRPSCVACRHHVVIRATYYTSCVGDRDHIHAIEESIRKLSFQQYQVYNVTQPPQLIATVTPHVVQRHAKNRPSKGVDIAMAVDVLTHVYQDNLDTVYLVTGDGDFEPLISECQRKGKQVFVAALSEGLSPRLRMIADEFISLDGMLLG